MIITLSDVIKAIDQVEKISAHHPIFVLDKLRDAGDVKVVLPTIAQIVDHPEAFALLWAYACVFHAPGKDQFEDRAISIVAVAERIERVHKQLMHRGLV